MAKSRNQKGKILILEHLLMETGENYAVTMQEILDKLLENGITAERKSIYDDLDALREFGLDIKYKRGKPGGYYISGKDNIKPVKNVSIETSEQEPAARVPVFEVICKDEIQLSAKPIKLLYDAAIEDKVKHFFGDKCEYKTKESGERVVTVPQTAGPNFYGWLVSMGNSICIQKPRKSAQAYRDYLKGIAKEYKGV